MLRASWSAAERPVPCVDGEGHRGATAGRLRAFPRPVVLASRLGLLSGQVTPRGSPCTGAAYKAFEPCRRPSPLLLLFPGRQ
ncbi:unnamed protein product [Rangifer tarandus platyrhynchus]|uniref:Uncharacterized protein n=2 Tax=Rangifer tarandus platyrhynchus TaxID=3082113 RepID=A0ABN8Z5W1_RANTA|nr:unnamed protein product [Rangifer tarandus platyrhynchus]CAI9704657.1 unnamed protein product [Rangifer tarandus platyrhynchus]